MLQPLIQEIQNKPEKATSKWMHWQLINRKKRIDDKMCRRWEEWLNKEIVDKEWESMTLDINKITLSTKLRAFQYKLINQIIVTNVHLKLWEIKPYNVCSFCENNQESYLHLFCKCPVIQSKVWQPLAKWLDYFCYIHLEINDAFVIIFNKYKGSFPLMVNTIVLIAKHYIYVK